MSKIIDLYQELLPDLYRHFQEEGLQISMYASSWFLTLYTTQLPLNIARRAMDLFLSEVGYSINEEIKIFDTFI